MSQNPEKNRASIYEFTQTVNVLHPDQETSKIYGEIKSELKKKGTLIPENDIWIASISIQNDLNLLTNDKHFKNVFDLKVENI